jgi:hypothetical protein
LSKNTFSNLSSHPPDSPDPSPCNFCLFGFLKELTKGMELMTKDHIVKAIATIWRGVIFEALQSVFQD